MTIEQLASSSGPAPIILGGLMVAALAWAAWGIRRCCRRGKDNPLDDLSPIELGLLHSNDHALLAALVGLRNADLISATGKPRHGPTTDSRAIADLDAVSREIFYGLPSHRRPLGLRRGRRSEALAQVHHDLTDRGYLVRPYGMRTLGPLGTVIALTAACLTAAIIMHEPFGVLIGVLSAGIVLIVGIRLFRPRRTLLGERAVRLAHTEHGHLSPSMHPSIRTYGPSAATIGTALFGLALLQQFAPTLAAGATAGGPSAGSFGGAGLSDGGFCGHGCSGCGGGGCGS